MGNLMSLLKTAIVAIVAVAIVNRSPLRNLLG